MSRESWSASKIGTFENCPKQFEFKYRQGLYDRPGSPDGVEALMGTIVHSVLEDIFRGQPPESPAAARALFETRWDARVADTAKPILVVKRNRTLESYGFDGARAVELFVRKWAPFDQDRTVAVEFPLRFEAAGYRFSGVIDRLAERPDGTLVIHDYKTKGRLPADAEVRASLQATLYAEGLRQSRPGTKVRIVWHHLLFGLETEFDAEGPNGPTTTVDQVIERIKRIENAAEFPTEKSPLCSWCQYKDLCPAWIQ